MTGRDEGSDTGDGEGRTGGGRAPLGRFSGALRAEWYAVVVDPVRRLARCGAGGLLLARVAAVGAVLLYAVARHPLGAAWVRRPGGGRPTVPVPRHPWVHRDGPPPAPPPLRRPSPTG